MLVWFPVGNDDKAPVTELLLDERTKPFFVPGRSLCLHPVPPCAVKQDTTVWRTVNAVRTGWLTEHDVQESPQVVAAALEDVQVVDLRITAVPAGSEDIAIMLNIEQA